MNLPFFIYQIVFLLLCSFLLIRKGKFYIVTALFFVSLFIVEYTCYRWFSKGINTNVVYNWWFPVEFIFYGFFLIKGDTKSKHFSITTILSLLYLTTAVIYYIAVQSQAIFSTLMYQVGEVYLLFLIGIKIREILKNEFQENPFNNSTVWLIIGLLLSNLGSLLHLSATNYLEVHDINLLNALRKLNTFLTEVLYFCIIIYFFIEWRKQKSNI